MIEGKRSHIGGDGTRNAVPVDLHRAIVFPNRVREQRRRRGYSKLLPLSAELPEIPYIRLSKIERGEVVARPDELRRIARALNLRPAELLLDIDSPEFDLAQWCEPQRGDQAVDLAAERFAVLLAAAVRARRTADPALTIAAIERDLGLPPVNLSRVENAAKTFDRWNAAVRAALFALFGVDGEAALHAHVETLHEVGALDPFISAVVDPEARLDRTRARIRALAEELDDSSADAPRPRDCAPAKPESDASASAALRVRGGVLPDGLIADSDTGETIAAPPTAGRNAFALRLSRAPLGAGLPAQTIVVADPDRQPAPGGLAALREEAGWRLLSVSSTRDGRMLGYGSNPEREIPLDDCDPQRLAALVSAIFP